MIPKSAKPVCTHSAHSGDVMGPILFLIVAAILIPVGIAVTIIARVASFGEPGGIE
jgi:mannose/fructose/N-acetylgalactosamine-specific phosphotransferase system component IID